MQINMVNLSPVGAKTAGTSKGGQSDGFGDVLKGLEEKGGTDITQLLAESGFLIPQQQQQTTQDEQGDSSQLQSDSEQKTAMSDMSVSGLSISSLAMQNLFALGGISQGAMLQGVVPQKTAQGVSAQYSSLSGNLSQGVSEVSNLLQVAGTQSAMPQAMLTQGGLSQGVVPQSAMSQGLSEQSGLMQAVAPQNILPQWSLSKGDSSGNLSQGVTMSNTAGNFLTTSNVPVQTVTNQAVTQGSNFKDFSVALNAMEASGASTQTLAANTVVNTTAMQGIPTQSVTTPGAGTPPAIQNFAVSSNVMIQNGQSNQTANVSQPVAATQQYQNVTLPHMIYGTQTTTGSYGDLTSNQPNQITGQPSQVSTAAANTPQLQQNVVLASQATTFQASNPSLSDKAQKVDGTTQISGVQATQVSSVAGAKDSSGTSQSGGKDTDSGSKHSDDGSTSQSIFGAVQASAIDTKYTQIASQAQKTDVANQLAGAVKQASNDGNSQISLHLSPEDLGGINIKIVSQGGVLSLQITADNAHTGQLIASGMHELTQSMHDAGLTMDKANVLFDSNGSFGTSSGSQQQSSGQDTSHKMPKWVNATQSSADNANTGENQTSETGTMSILA
jgi:flagellar hook-length control protein FliK